MSHIIVEIPHQLPAKAWVAWAEQDIINIAREAESMTYCEWSLESALECWGERDEIPEELLEMLDAEGKVIEFSHTDGNYCEFYTVDEAPTELECAKEAIFHDLYSHRILSEEEARAFISGDHSIYCGHQMIEARQAVRKVLQDYFND